MRRSLQLPFVVALVASQSCGEAPERVATSTRPEVPRLVVPTAAREAAFLVDVSRLRRRVVITPPRAPLVAARLAPRTDQGDGTLASLLGGDVVDLVATNYQAGTLGAVVPNRILITFDLQVVNKLTAHGLSVPTWPLPPVTAAGPLLFPFEIGVTATSGGVSVGAPGNEVIVTSPQGGAVSPSADWDGNGAPGSGAPHNFFNDVGCTAASNDCFRYEEYGPIGPAGSSTARRVGFLVDPSVGDFRAKLILAADLLGAGPVLTGTVSGTVTSSLGGPVAGAQIVVSGGWGGTSDVVGAYLIPGVATGPRVVSVTNLPAGCTPPAAQTVTVAAGQVSTANFLVSCTPPPGPGTVTGVVSSPTFGNISGATVTLSSGQSATTASSGAFTLLGIPAGTWTASVGTLPSGCAVPAAQSITVASGQVTTVNFTVTCGPPPAGTINGTVTSNWAVEPAWKATIVVTPTGGSPLPPVIAGSQGQYSVSGVPVTPGTGTITVTPTLQPWCQAQTVPYSGLVAGTPLVVNVSIPCARPPQTYVARGTWGNIQSGGPTGRRVNLFVSVDMGPAPGRPDVNGSAADELVGARLRITYPPALLQFVSVSGLDPAFNLVSATPLGAGVLQLDLQRSTPGSRAGNVELARLVFDIPAGAIGSATLAALVERLLAETFADPVDPNQSASVSFAVLPIP